MSQGIANPFKPITGSTVQRTVTTTSANVLIPLIAQGATAVRVQFTAGTAAARFRTGVGSGTTAVTLIDTLCPNPGTPFVYAESFGFNGSDTYIAAITDAGTCTMEFTFGFGT